MHHVSIRDADFLALQHCSAIRNALMHQRFYPRCGFFSVATCLQNPSNRQATVSIRDADFLALQLAPTEMINVKRYVSIRDADFLALQLELAHVNQTKE